MFRGKPGRFRREADTPGALRVWGWRVWHYAQQRCAPAVDMPGRGQLLRTCPHPLDNPLSPPREADISILRESGHFYFALTRSGNFFDTGGEARGKIQLLITGLGDIVNEESELVLGDTNCVISSTITALGVRIFDDPLTQKQMDLPVEELFSLELGADNDALPMTLLVDNFDCMPFTPFTPDGKTQTTAESISGFSGEKGGTPSKFCKFVETEYGQGIQLYRPPATK